MMDIKRLKLGADSKVTFFDLKTGKEILTTDAYNVTINLEERKMSMEIVEELPKRFVSVGGTNYDHPQSAREEYDRWVEAGFITPPSVRRTTELTSCFLDLEVGTPIDNDITCNLGDLDIKKHFDKPVYTNAKAPKESWSYISGAVASINPCEQFLKDVYDEWGNADPYSVFSPSHSEAYRSIGAYALGLASTYPHTEPLSMKDRKKKYRESTRKFLNKGRKW